MKHKKEKKRKKKEERRKKRLRLLAFVVEKLEDEIHWASL